MNEKAQVFTPITMIFIVIAFLICWVLFLGKFLNDMIDLGASNFSGIEAFLYGNLNFFVMIALIGSIVALGYYSTR